MADSQYHQQGAVSAPHTGSAGLAGDAAPSSPNDSGFRTTPEHASTPEAVIADSQSSPGSSLSSALSSLRKSPHLSEGQAEDSDEELDEIIVAQPGHQRAQSDTDEVTIKPEPRSSASPPHERRSRVKTGNIIEDSHSELSELSATPPPPSPMRRAIQHLERPIECRCDGWCTCPKHKAYPQNAPAHLSEWALSQKTEASVSAMRSTLYLPQQSPTEFEYPSKGVASQCHAAAYILSRLDGTSGTTSTPTTTINKALRLAQDIITSFPPCEDTPRRPSAIQRVVDAMRIWQKDGSYENLWANFDGAVNGSPDLILAFQTFLPRDRERAGMSELWQARVEGLAWERGEREGTPFGWVGG
ncbi:hypothetical protein LTR85_010295 [Meristemomyces frigidus]|nr:hypothetical protein LTR85_010295 [Meristemomyces frigidus]